MEPGGLEPPMRWAETEEALMPWIGDERVRREIAAHRLHNSSRPSMSGPVIPVARPDGTG
jgi:hypothetical protein